MPCSRCRASGAHHLCEMPETIEAQIAELEQISAAITNEVQPHIADKIEAGAILYSSWGYDQTNVDYYMVTRTTKASAWIVPMRHVETPSEGYSPMSGNTTPLEPMATEWTWENGERVERPIVPEMHRIRRSDYGDRLTLTSYSSARPWDGRSLYASHYA